MAEPPTCRSAIDTFAQAMYGALREWVDGEEMEVNMEVNMEVDMEAARTKAVSSSRALASCTSKSAKRFLSIQEEALANLGGLLVRLPLPDPNLVIERVSARKAARDKKHAEVVSRVMAFVNGKIGPPLMAVAKTLLQEEENPRRFRVSGQKNMIEFAEYILEFFSDRVLKDRRGFELERASALSSASSMTRRRATEYRVGEGRTSGPSKATVLLGKVQKLRDWGIFTFEEKSYLPEIDLVEETSRELSALLEKYLVALTKEALPILQILDEEVSGLSSWGAGQTREEATALAVSRRLSGLARTSCVDAVSALLLPLFLKFRESLD